MYKRKYSYFNNSDRIFAILYRVIINDCPIAVGMKNHTNFRCTASLAPLDNF
jgi:hypothetical protein